MARTLPALNDRTLLQYIRQLPHAKANFKQLVREFGVKGESKEELVQELKAAKERVGKLYARWEELERIRAASETAEVS